MNIETLVSLTNILIESVNKLPDSFVQVLLATQFIDKEIRKHYEIHKHKELRDKVAQRSSEPHETKSYYQLIAEQEVPDTNRDEQLAYDAWEYFFEEAKGHEINLSVTAAGLKQLFSISTALTDLGSSTVLALEKIDQLQKYKQKDAHEVILRKQATYAVSFISRLIGQLLPAVPGFEIDINHIPQKTLNSFTNQFVQTCYCSSNRIYTLLTSRNYYLSKAFCSDPLYELARKLDSHRSDLGCIETRNTDLHNLLAYCSTEREQLEAAPSQQNNRLLLVNILWMHCKNQHQLHLEANEQKCLDTSSMTIC